MRNRVFAFRNRILGQAAIVAILAGASAACSDDAYRLREPFFTGSTANQREIIDDDQPMPAPIPGSAIHPAPGGGVVMRNDLPPPPNVVASSGPLSTAPGAAPKIGGAYGWTAVGGTVATVGPGESLDTLSLRYGVPANEIAKANQISSPTDLTAGRTIVIPIRTAMIEPAPVPRAPTAIAPTAMAPTAPPMPKAEPRVASIKAGGTYVVQPNQTLYSIAREHGASVSDMIALNGLTPAAEIHVGQELKLPSDAVAAAPRVAIATPGPGAPPKPLGMLSEKKVIASLEPKTTLVPPASTRIPPVAPKIPAAPKIQPAATKVQPAPAVAVALAAPKSPDVPAVPAVPAPPSDATAALATAPAAADTSTDVASATGTAFRWPVRGRIISSFGTKPNGERNDGINLAVPEGTSVKAAEAGTVIYAGNELEGYGNLVLIRHADGWVSAYAHNGSILVKRGDPVRRGENIAIAGMTGSVKTPQVHFELRKGSKPVNPLDYLAGA